MAPSPSKTMFQGAAQISLDAKGRLAVPAKHREALQAVSEGRLVLTAHPHKCLLLYPEPAWGPIAEKIMGFSSFDPRSSAWQRLLVGHAEEIELDGSGRILVSPVLRRYAGLARQVMFVGQGSHYEVWSLEAWEAQLANALADAGLPAGMESFAL